MNENRRGRRGATAVLTVLLSVLGLLGTTTSAGAVTGYHTSGNDVRVRAGASTATTQVGIIRAAGTAIDIACQVQGQTVSLSGWGTSAIWDRLNGYNGYISDLFVRETPYAQFDSRTPRCDAPPPPPPPTYTTAQAVNIRSAPSFNATLLGQLPAGTAITIQCQNYGTFVNGSSIWDKVGEGFISDFYVNGTPFNAFDSRLPRCGLAYQPVDCAKVLFLGARGSGEEFGPENLGPSSPPSAVQETRNLLAERGVSLDVEGVIYPAHDVSVIGTQGWATWYSGVDQGRDEMLRLLRKRTDGNVCGWQNTRAVLVGYSQGAMVVGNAIAQMTPQERASVIGVVTYGNPHFNPAANGAVGGNGEPGKLGPRGAYADGLDQRSRDYCRTEFICTASSPDVDSHLHYQRPNPQTTWGADFLAARAAA